MYTSRPPLRFSAIAFLIFLSSALVGGFLALAMATSLPSPSMYVSACAACLVASLFADSSQSYEPCSQLEV